MQSDGGWRLTFFGKSISRSEPPFPDWRQVDYTSVAMRFLAHFTPKLLRSAAGPNSLLACGLALSCLVAPPAGRPQAPAKSGRLLIYFIDVEGGQSTLLVSPTGASLLVDTGWPSADARDVGRIQAAMAD